MKVQFGSGPNQLDGWTNLQENEGNITKPLKFASDSIDAILIEHVLEHVSHQDAWRFLKEAHRILKPSGAIRIIVPSVSRIWNLATEDYLAYIHNNIEYWSATAKVFPDGQGNVMPNKLEAVFAIVFLHGHKSCWSTDILQTFMLAHGFIVTMEQYGHSLRPEFQDVDQHWKLMGLERCKIESIVAEGTKP